MTDVIYSDSGLDLEARLDHAVQPDLLELLDQTIWGQHGVNFQSLDMAEMLQNLSDPSFLRLVKNGRTVAAAVRNHKQVWMAGTKYDAFHLALFSVHHDFKRHGYGAILAQVSRTHYRGLLRTPGVLYGYIESGNEASLRLNLGLGYQDMREIRPRLFSRTRPRPSSRVEALGREGYPGMLKHLKKAYRAHGLCCFECSLDPDRYYVVRHHGEIVAGAQLHIVHWKLLGLPGWRGQLAMNLLPSIPLLGRDFTPSNLRFARVGNLYAKKGHESLVAEILETFIAEQRLPFAAVLADQRGDTERRVISGIEFGVIDRMITGCFHLVGEFKGTEQNELDNFSEMPVIISPRDPL